MIIILVPVDGQRIKRFEAYNMYCQTRRQGVMWCPDKSPFASFSAVAGLVATLPFVFALHTKA